MFTSPVFVIIDDFALNVHIISKRTVLTSNKPHTVMVCANSSDLDGKLQRRYRELCTKYFPRSLSMHILRNAIDTSQTKMVKSNTKKRNVNGMLVVVQFKASAESNENKSELEQ